MKQNGILFALLAFVWFAITGCGNNELDKDVEPLADAMCKFIEIQNNLKGAFEANDSLNIQKFSAEKHKMNIEITILNQEFQEKYGDLVMDQDFGKKFKRAMNKYMVDCPHISPEDREKMEAELNE
ncbi:MAG: hypothetical protein ISS19_02800 [Bacteroidales bacterium]|nr:hypothetical protein [Bacteroidales bacterium]